MRVFWSYAFSALVHGTVIGALIWWNPLRPMFELRFRRGDSVVLSAAFSQPAAPASEPPTIVSPVEEPEEPHEPAAAPTIESPVRPPTETLVSAPPIEVERSELQVDRTIELQEVVSEDSPSPAPAQVEKPDPPRETQPIEVAEASLPKPARTTSKTLPVPVGELSEATPFQTAVELGNEVDELPSQHPTNRKPAYPADALAARIEGTVRLRVLIDVSGQVKEVGLETSSGHSSLDQSAIAGVRQWRFSPARRRGTAVPYEVIIPVRFSIRS